MSSERGGSRSRLRDLIALSATLCLVAGLAACGQGGGDGAEDTGSILLISTGTSSQTQVNRNVDTNLDVDGDGTADPHDHYVSMTFTNRSVVPDIARPGTTTEAASDTDTFIRVTGYRIDYVANTAGAPTLTSQEFDTTFWLGLIGPEEQVERGDVVLVPWETIEEYLAGASSASMATTAPEYTAHYTFFFETTRFNEEGTATVNVSFNIGDFADSQ